MDIQLKFKITRVDGEIEDQEITAPAANDPNITFDQQRMIVMQRMFNQYAQVGMLRQPSKDHFILLCPSQIAFVECELNSVLIANALDVPPAPRGGLVSG
jgi:hypothetical protein